MENGSIKIADIPHSLFGQVLEKYENIWKGFPMPGELKKDWKDMVTEISARMGRTVTEQMAKRKFTLIKSYLRRKNERLTKSNKEGTLRASLLVYYFLAKQMGLERVCKHYDNLTKRTQVQYIAKKKFGIPEVVKYPDRVVMEAADSPEMPAIAVKDEYEDEELFIPHTTTAVIANQEFFGIDEIIMREDLPESPATGVEEKYEDEEDLYISESSEIAGGHDELYEIDSETEVLIQIGSPETPESPEAPAVKDEYENEELLIPETTAITVKEEKEEYEDNESLITELPEIVVVKEEYEGEELLIPEIPAVAMRQELHNIDDEVVIVKEELPETNALAVKEELHEIVEVVMKEEEELPETSSTVAGQEYSIALLKEKIAMLEKENQALEAKLLKCVNKKRDLPPETNANNKAELFAKMICEQKNEEMYIQAEKDICQALYVHSHKGYKFMREHLQFKLPSLLMLQKWCQEELKAKYTIHNISKESSGNQEKVTRSTRTCTS